MDRARSTATKITAPKTMIVKPGMARLPDWLHNRYLQCALLFYGAMFVLGSFRALERSFIWTFNDKLLHFAAYFVLTVLVYLGLRSRPSGELFLPRMFWCLAIASGAGALDEIAQYLVGRDSSFDDWLADTAAAIVILCAITAGHLLHALWQRLHPPPEPRDDSLDN